MDFSLILDLWVFCFCFIFIFVVFGGFCALDFLPLRAMIPSLRAQLVVRGNLYRFCGSLDFFVVCFVLGFLSCIFSL